VKNKYGTWLVKHHTDIDEVVNPNYESDLEKYFKIKNGIFIDVGAHVGRWSVYVLRNSKNTSAYAIEANQEIFKYLANNVKLNKLEKRMKPRNIGFSSKTGKVYFESKVSESGLSKIVKTKGKNTIEIKVISLDKFAIKEKINAKK